MVGKTIHGKDRALVLKVLDFFEREKEISKLTIPVDLKKEKQKVREDEKTDRKLIPVDQPVNRTCAATGISKSTLMRIKREMRAIISSESPMPSTSSSASIPELSTPGKRRKPSAKKIILDSFDLVALRNIVNSFYTVQKEVPTLSKILSAAKKDLNFPGEKTTLRLILVKQLRYKFKKCKNGRFIMIQKPEIAAWRDRYLRRMKENYELGPLKKPVTYLDETWVNSDYTARKCWKNISDVSVEKNKNPAQTWILVHAGGKDGFIPEAELLYKCKSNTDDNHREMDTRIFLTWLKEKLIPNLPPYGIVVIDNAPYHSTELETIPSMSASKSEMQEWLLNRNISFEENMTERELYHLILINKPEKIYVVDELLREHGHEVLRLPPYHCDLNPIEYIWNIIKQRVVEKNIDQSELQMEKLIKAAIKSIKVEDWKKEVKHVKRLQKEYWDNDRLQEAQEKEFIVSLGGEESLSESESEDDNEGDMSGMVEVNYSDDSE